MKITIDDGGLPPIYRATALRVSATFAECHPRRASGQRNCVIYGNTVEGSPVYIAWWTASRNISVLIKHDDLYEAVDPIAPVTEQEARDE